jgi:ATP-dependent helicase/DNAse subunit B
MTTQIYLAPAAAGKTSYAIKLAREAAKGLTAEVRVCVASRLQAQSWRRRLAESGGAIGVQVMTFDDLYLACLGAAGENYTRVEDAVEYRLLQNVVATQPLEHYESIRQLPGFPIALQSFIKEMKSARVLPEDLLKAIVSLGDPPRLRELGQLYEQYQFRLQQQDWADYAGFGWLAVEALENNPQILANQWPWLIVDGFDSFTEVQLSLLQILAGRVGELIITMTGLAGDQEPRVVHHRFYRTQQQLEGCIHVEAVALPEQITPSSALAAHLEDGLFADDRQQFELSDGANDVLKLVEAPDRASEAREALRWLKERIVQDQMRPDELALVARNLSPYQPFIVETAAEFGLPIRLLHGLPLASNPAVAALIDLLRLVLPQGDLKWTLPRKGIVAAWRSPYFDWGKAIVPGGKPEPMNIVAEDADILDTMARRGRVVAGQEQWQEMFAALVARQMHTSLVEERRLPSGLPSGQDAGELHRKFKLFLERIKPKQELNFYREYVSWLEELIGPEPEVESDDEGGKDILETSLSMSERISQGEPSQKRRDFAAIHKLKEILRGLTWNEGQQGQDSKVEYAQFFSDLLGAIEAASYEPGESIGQEAILVAEAIRIRGVPFRAIALLGLAEGEFPATLREDPFLRESDRRLLRQDHGLEIESSIESTEREFFYEMVTGFSEKLLLTRPRLSDTGAEWLPSPFWEEGRRLVKCEPDLLTTDSLPEPSRAASKDELVESLVAYPEAITARETWQKEDPGRWSNLEQAASIFLKRYAGAHTVYDGDLRDSPEIFTRHFQPTYGWSPSALESYRSCGFYFFSARVLQIKPREEPEDGLDVAQLGTLYHQIFEALYASLEPVERLDAERLLTALPLIAGPILERAPEQQGFRVTAWWQQIREEILDNIARSIRALNALADEFIPIEFEAHFFGQDCLVVHDGSDQFQLHGIVDRIDQNSRGQLRIIDYKTTGPFSYSKKSLEKGEKLQLPLYALAVRDALKMGDPVDGFYWHIRQAKPSGLTLDTFGPEEAIQLALAYAWEAVHGARQGSFLPVPPSGGCPSYCPAAGFCWQYRPAAWR